MQGKTGDTGKQAGEEQRVKQDLCFSLRLFSVVNPFLLQLTYQSMSTTFYGPNTFQGCTPKNQGIGQIPVLDYYSEN
jgi:hypothetical protein